MNKIKTYEDACEALGLHPASPLPFAEAKNDHQKAVNAFSKLIIINKALNEGWKPNWKDDDEYKYYPWFDMEDDKGSGLGLSYGGYGCDGSDSNAGSRLVFRTSELAKYAGTQFIDLYAYIMVIPGNN